MQIKYLESSLIARWDDEDPKVIEAMFLLPQDICYCSTEVIDRLLLRCWRESGDQWNSLLFRVIDTLKVEPNLKDNSAKYTVLLLPFLISSPANIKESVLKIDLAFFKSLSEYLFWERVHQSCVIS